MNRLVKPAPSWLALVVSDPRRRLALAVVLILFIAVGVTLLALGPLAWLLAGDTVKALDGKDRADGINDVRRTLITAIGGAAAMVAIAYTARTYHLSKRGQVTDRFSRAVAQLASSEVEERLGGIHALEQVMAESPRDHDAVVAILCAFVRRRTLIPPTDRVQGAAIRRGPVPQDEEPDFDIDASMTVIARRPVRAEPNRPDLRHVSLPRLSIRAYDFAEAPRLTRMFLTGADLRSADLRGADMRGTIATFADLSGAWLSGADLRRASFSRAIFSGADFRGTLLLRTMLDGADLREVEGLTPEQLSGASIDARTLLPASLASDPWVEARLIDCDVPEAEKTPWFCPPPTPAP